MVSTKIRVERINVLTQYIIDHGFDVVVYPSYFVDQLTIIIKKAGLEYVWFMYLTQFDDPAYDLERIQKLAFMYMTGFSVYTGGGTPQRIYERPSA